MFKKDEKGRSAHKSKPSTPQSYLKPSSLTSDSSNHLQLEYTNANSYGSENNQYEIFSASKNVEKRYSQRVGSNLECNMKNFLTNYDDLIIGLSSLKNAEESKPLPFKITKDAKNAESYVSKMPENSIDLTKETNNSVSKSPKKMAYRRSLDITNSNLTANNNNFQLTTTTGASIFSKAGKVELSNKLQLNNIEDTSDLLINSPVCKTSKFKNSSSSKI